VSSFPFMKLSLGTAIGVIGHRLGMTDQDIASELNVKVSTVRRWKGGGHVPLYRTIKPLQAIAKRANIEITPESMMR